MQTAVTIARAFAAALANEPVSSPVSQVWQMSSNTLVDSGNLVRRINVYAPFRDGHQTLVFNTPNEPSRTAALNSIIYGEAGAAELSWSLQALETGEEVWHGPDDAFDPSATQPAFSYAVPYTGPGTKWSAWCGSIFQQQP